MIGRLKSFSTVITLLVLFCQSATAADWLTAENEKNAASALLARLQTTGIQLDGEPADQFAGALLAIRGMADRIDAWGQPAILAQAPRFDEAIGNG